MLPTKTFPGQFLWSSFWPPPFQGQFERRLGWNKLSNVHFLTLQRAVLQGGGALGIRKGVKISSCPSGAFCIVGGGLGWEGRCNLIGSVLLEGDVEEGEMSPSTSLEFLWLDK